VFALKWHRESRAPLRGFVPKILMSDSCRRNGAAILGGELLAAPVTLLRSHSIRPKMLDNNEDPFTAIPSSYDQVSRFQKKSDRVRLPAARANAIG